MVEIARYSKGTWTYSNTPKGIEKILHEAVELGMNERECSLIQDAFNRGYTTFTDKEPMPREKGMGAALDYIDRRLIASQAEAYKVIRTIIDRWHT